MLSADLSMQAVEGMRASKNVRGLVNVIQMWTKPELQVAALKALGDIGDASAIQPITKELRDWRNEKIVLLSALDALAKIGPPSVKPLIEVMSREPAHDRYTSEMLFENAAKALARIGEPAVEPLINALEQGGWGRWLAIMALGDIGDARAIAPLIKFMKGDFVGSVSRPIVMAIAMIGKASVEPLLTALKDENDNMRQGAAMALGEIKDSRALEPLTETLRDKSSFVGSEAALALGKLASPKAVDPLIQSVEDNRQFPCS